MRKIAICDDNESVIQAIQEIVQDYYLKHKVEINTFLSGEELLASQEHFDAIFMDVEMDNINGIETAYEIRKTDIDVFIIIVSGIPLYKNSAYPIHAFDFLDKPINKARVQHVLSQLDLYYEKQKKVHYVSFKVKEGYIKLDVSDILYFSYDERRIKIVTKIGKYDFYDNLTLLAQNMKKYNFSISHRAFIVNLDHVVQVCSSSVVLDDQSEIPLSRQRAKEFKKDYTMYISKFYR